MHDAVVIGGGHNGLVAAAYLARAGRSVVVLERREHVGGAAVSERPWAGVDARLSRYAYLVSLLPRALTNATLPFVLHVADVGVEQAARDNPGLAKGVNVVGGKVTYRPVAEATGQPYAELFDALAEVA